MNARFSQAYWVVPEKLMAGGYPGSGDPDEVQQNLKALLDDGISHLINLTKEYESVQPGNRFFSYEEQMSTIAESRGLTVSFDRMPIKDFWIPSRVDMCRILDRIDECIAHNKPVYVHCWGGRGRTGTVVGCYLARHGYAEDQKILELIQQVRKDTEESHLASPETPQQIDMVLSWVEGE
jgi:protein tyrosine/serine phosphatase